MSGATVNKNTVILLDVDGVINEPQQACKPEMQSLLQRLAMHYQVYFVTGNGYTKTVDILNGPIGKFMGVFCNNADELRTMRGKLVWQDTYTKPLPRLDFCLMSLLRDKATGNNCIEWRSPRFVNISTIGRYADEETRRQHNGSWREYIAHIISDDEVECSIGGQVSIDIYSKGADKSRAAKYINSQDKNFLFIGDKTSPGGNDYPIVQYCELNPENICLTTVSYLNTMEIINSLLE